MTETNFADATLILLGHGTTRNEGSSAPVFQNAAELRRRRLFAAVREAFWKQQPAVSRVLAEVATPRAFIVPLFVSEGYFSEEIIPRELGFRPASGPSSRVAHSASRITYYCKPIGTHDSMAGVLLARAREVIEECPSAPPPPPAETTLFIAGHGTQRHENSRRAIERQADLVRARALFANVNAVFLEETPRVCDCYILARTRDVIVIPFFISDGLHSAEDIPVLLGESRQHVDERLRAGRPTWRNPTERHGKRVWYAGAVGTDARVADVILERVREMAV